jgi:hypothetical protein
MPVSLFMLVYTAFLQVYLCTLFFQALVYDLPVLDDLLEFWIVIRVNAGIFLLLRSFHPITNYRLALDALH